MYILHTVRKG